MSEFPLGKSPDLEMGILYNLRIGNSYLTIPDTRKKLDKDNKEGKPYPNIT